jgi:RNA polymerase sigma-70 factor (ECF subfamily)
MTHPDDPPTETLLRSAATGSGPALQKLLTRHRERLVKMVANRLDPRVSARIDASDVVQEALTDAARKFEDYLRDRPLPFYPWLHRLASERLSKEHRRHLRLEVRGADREVSGSPAGSDLRPVDRVPGADLGPVQALIREEERREVRQVLDGLTSRDREVLVMRYLEGLSFAEMAERLGLAEGTVKVRHFRALERLRAKMAWGDPGGPGR